MTKIRKKELGEGGRPGPVLCTCAQLLLSNAAASPSTGLLPGRIADCKADQNFQIDLRPHQLAVMAAAAENGASEPAWEGGQVLFSGGTDWAQVGTSTSQACSAATVARDTGR